MTNVVRFPYARQHPLDGRPNEYDCIWEDMDPPVELYYRTSCGKVKVCIDDPESEILRLFGKGGKVIYETFQHYRICPYCKKRIYDASPAVWI